MKLIKISEITKEIEQDIIDAIKNGKIFIYPTDTIYGIGCNALIRQSVKKIKEIKNRDKDKPLSIIAPNFDWIGHHLLIDCDLHKYLPGPYTIILKKKYRNYLTYVSKNDSFGIRIPDCDFTKIIQKSKIPFITTSVNLSGEPFITKISDIKQEILNKIDYIIDAEELNGRPSTLIINGEEVRR